MHRCRPTHHRRQIWIAALVLALGPGLAHGEGVYTNWRGLAIRGADPVAYFEQGRHVEGDAEHSYAWRGATWRFASAEHRERFAASPERYAPAYGGYCAYAMARGDRVKSDPAQWSIVDNRLFLNYSAGIKSRWERDVPGFVEKADREWNRLRKD